MRIHQTLESWQPEISRPLVAALGNFDGVHLGHQKILARVVENAESLHGVPAVITFFDHPQKVLHPETQPPALILSRIAKLCAFYRLGIQKCFLLAFTPEFANQEPERFVEHALVEKLRVRKIALGQSARFGHLRRGDSVLMRELADRYSFEFEEIPALSVEGELVSSSRIRRLLKDGSLEAAAACLGRPYGFMGPVEKGERRGTAMDVPTANIRLEMPLLIPEGVYAVSVREIDIRTEGDEFSILREGEWRPGILNYGRNPTFSRVSGMPGAEVHVLDYDGDLYGKLLEVFVHPPRLRPELKFESPEALKCQISKDIALVRGFFNRSAGPVAL